MNRPVAFASNLKYYRTQYGLTQKQLADQIGYTEKSISKWESSHGFPSVEMLIKLADMFHVSVDALIFEKVIGNYLLGIDGGGTKTAFVLADEDGNILNKVCKGASNPNDIGIENTKAILKDGIKEICGGIPYSKITMFAGLSGGGLTGDYANILHGFFGKYGFLAFDNGSDIENLCALAEREECILVIMGTGFIVYAINGKQRKRISGWGRDFDKGGSGYTLGRDAIAAVLRAGDGSGEPTRLTELLLEQLGETAEAHLAKFYNGGKKYIAGFANLVFEAAKRGDRVANSILEDNMAFVAHMINTASGHIFTASEKTANNKGIPVLISGGISAEQDVLFPLIEKRLGDVRLRLVRLEKEPVEGALKRAEKIFQERMGENK